MICPPITTERGRTMHRIAGVVRRASAAYIKYPSLFYATHGGRSGTLYFRWAVASILKHRHKLSRECVAFACGYSQESTCEHGITRWAEIDESKLLVDDQTSRLANMTKREIEGFAIKALERAGIEEAVKEWVPFEPLIGEPEEVKVETTTAGE